MLFRNPTDTAHTALYIGSICWLAIASGSKWEAKYLSFFGTCPEFAYSAAWELYAEASKKQKEKGSNTSSFCFARKETGKMDELIG